jgi:LuxR family maltose regulon positive regulatory protein
MVSQLPDKRLAVIKAPAGFGKTSLATAWFERLRQSGNSAAWLAIDPEDDSPPSFLCHVCKALGRECRGVGASAISLIEEQFLIDPFSILSMLINDLAESDEEIFLFLEDYHWINNAETHEALTFLLRHAPSHFHVVLTSRLEPGFSLASMCAQNQLLEIDTSALRFDLQETQDFIGREKLGTLDPSDLKLLHSKTEGWPAALRIVASTFSQLGQDLSTYVRNLSSKQRPIGAYLAELLEGLPSELVVFMLRTAILDRLSVPLCEYVTGNASAEDLLATIERRQLLLRPLDPEGNWYRHHTLFLEFLRQRLQAEFGNEIASLHRRASVWYASQELWTDAVQHAILGGDTDQALSWIKNCAMALIKKGDLFTLLGWQRLLPSELLRSQPEVRLAIAWGLSLATRSDEAIQLVLEIEQDARSNPGGADAVLCECQAIRSVAIALQDDRERALTFAEDCLNRSNDPWTANVASNVVRYNHLKAGNLQKFYATPWIPYSLEEDRRNVFASVYRRCIQGMAEVHQLRFGSAERYYKEGLRLAEQYVGSDSVAASLPASLISHIRYEQGRLDEAEAMLIERVSFIGAGMMLDCALSAYFVMVRVAAWRGNFERAYVLLERAGNLGTARAWGRLCAAAAEERARLYLIEGRIDEGAACVAEIERLEIEYSSAPCIRVEIHRYALFAQAHLALAQGRPENAASLLISLQREAESIHNHYLALRAAIYLAVARMRASQMAEALSGFRSLLRVSAPAGIYQSVLDSGPGVGDLLIKSKETAPRSGGPPEFTAYVDRLIEGWRLRYESTAGRPSRIAIAESLTAREGEILKLIAQGLSNKEMARTLAVSPETVKSHVKRVFAKLGVERRVQAVSHAQSIGLISTN